MGNQSVEFSKDSAETVKVEKARVSLEEGRGSWVGPTTRSILCVLAEGDHLKASLREKSSQSACSVLGYSRDCQDCF